MGTLNLQIDSATQEGGCQCHGTAWEILKMIIVAQSMLSREALRVFPELQGATPQTLRQQLEKQLALINER